MELYRYLGESSSLWETEIYSTSSPHPRLELLRFQFFRFALEITLSILQSSKLVKLEQLTVVHKRYRNNERLWGRSFAVVKPLHLSSQRNHENHWNKQTNINWSKQLLTKKIFLVFCYPTSKQVIHAINRIYAPMCTMYSCEPLKPCLDWYSLFRENFGKLMNCTNEN